MSDNTEAKLFALDSLSNVMLGLGTKNDPMKYNKISQRYLLDKATLENMYMGNGIASLIVNKIPEEMTRAGFKVEGISEENKKRLESDLESLDLKRKMREAVTFARLYGGAAIVFGLNDGQILSQPLNKARIKAVEFLRVYDRHQISEYERETNPRNPNYGQVKLWAITPSRGMMYLVHHTRMQFFDGEILPNQIREQNNGWGKSVLQDCYDEVLRVTGSHDFTLQVLNRIQQAIHGMKNLASTLAQPGGEAIVAKRLQTVDMTRGVLNTIVIDSEETYTIETQSLSGIKDVLKEFVALLAAVSGYPAFVLGQSLGGLNSTGDKEAKVWYEKIESEQNFVLRKPLVFLIETLLNIYGESSSDWKIVFNPLAALTEAEVADIEKTEAEVAEIRVRTFAAAVDNGFVDKQLLKEELSEYLEVDIKTMPTEAPKDKLTENNQPANNANNEGGSSNV
jgi:phage-related protein (TIGR01555 family)